MGSNTEEEDPKTPRKAVIEWNRAWDVFMFMCAAGIIWMFLGVGSIDNAADLANILFGAFLGAAGTRVK
jgi:hypothetical protein